MLMELQAVVVIQEREALRVPQILADIPFSTIINMQLQARVKETSLIAIYNLILNLNSYFFRLCGSATSALWITL